MHSNLETSILRLVFNGDPIEGLAINAKSHIKELYISLHTDDPSSGNQMTHETKYKGYSRCAVSRDDSGWAVSCDSGPCVGLTSDKDFPQSASEAPAITHFVIGTAASGSGSILCSGKIHPPIRIFNGVIPRITKLSIFR